MCARCESRVEEIAEAEKRVLLARVHEAGKEIADVFGCIEPGHVEGFLVAYAALHAIARSLERTFGPRMLELGKELAELAAAEKLAEAGLSAEGMQ